MAFLIPHQSAYSHAMSLLRLSLDHLTAVDADPEMLVDAAAAADCAGICLFLHSLDVLPLMPHFDLVNDAAARRNLKRRMDAAGVTLDLAYPFTLSGRTAMDDLRPALACAAELGAGLVNVLAYERDAARRTDRFGEFCEITHGYGLGVVVEFYPVSQVRSLADAIALADAVNRSGQVGVNVDLLHLIRSGGSLAELSAAPNDMILLAQVCDGPATVTPDRLAAEASSARILAGEGEFDLAGFAAALPPGCKISVEIPRDAAIAAGESLAQRVGRAVAGVRGALTREDYRQHLG